MFSSIYASFSIANTGPPKAFLFGKSFLYEGTTPIFEIQSQNLIVGVHDKVFQK